MSNHQSVSDTISDFGRQWQEYTENRGFYASQEALKSLIHPLLTEKDLKNSDIADVGAGTGRYAIMFNRAKAKKVVAFEPSDAFSVLERNVAGISGIECFKRRADQIENEKRFNWVFSVGVLQFIKNPESALKAMGNALKKNGKVFVWVYSVENNRLYLALALPIRKLTTKLSHAKLIKATSVLLPLVEWYALAAKRFKRLPMADYLTQYFLKVDRYTRKVIIHDQLNPSYVKYYRKEELKALFQRCGFKDIQMHHRMGYSWSVMAGYENNIK